MHDLKPILLAAAAVLLLWLFRRQPRELRTTREEDHD
jgi:hypothetical protein